MNWKFQLYAEEEYTKIRGWDVVRPKSSVDKGQVLIYNINVLKRKYKKIKYKELKGKKKMRVTKIIREYVEEAVNGIYNP